MKLMTMARGISLALFFALAGACGRVAPAQKSLAPTSQFPFATYSRQEFAIDSEALERAEKRVQAVGYRATLFRTEAGTRLARWDADTGFRLGVAPIIKIKLLRRYGQYLDRQIQKHSGFQTPDWVTSKRPDPALDWSAKRALVRETVAALMTEHHIPDHWVASASEPPLTGSSVLLPETPQSSDLVIQDLSGRMQIEVVDEDEFNWLIEHQDYALREGAVPAVDPSVFIRRHGYTQGARVCGLMAPSGFRAKRGDRFDINQTLEVASTMGFPTFVGADSLAADYKVMIRCNRTNGSSTSPWTTGELQNILRGVVRVIIQ